MTAQVFRYDFAPGMRLRYQVTVDGRIKVMSPFGKMNNLIDITMIIDQQVVSREADLSLIKVRIEKVTANCALDPSQLPKPGVTALMQADSLGNVSWVEGSAWQGAEHSIMKFPEQPLNIGDFWLAEVEQASGSATAFFAKYTFKGFDKKNEQLAIFNTAIYSAHPDSPDATITGKGAFRFDMKTKSIESCDNETNYKYSMPIPENPALRMDTETNLSIGMQLLPVSE